MRVKLVRQWKHLRPGRVLTLGDGVAELLILQRKAVEVSDEETIENMVPDRTRRTATKTRRRRSGGNQSRRETRSAASG